MFKSIRTRTTVTFIALATIPLLLVGLLLGLQGYQQEQKQVLEAQGVLAQQVRTRVLNFITELELQLDTLIEVYRIVNLDIPQLQQILQQVIAYEGEFDELSLLNATGDVQVHISRFTSSSSPPTNYQDTDAFLYPLNANQTYYSPVRFNATTGEPRMTIALPIIGTNQEFRGVLIAEVRMKKIWDIIAETPVDAGESVYILEANGRIIAHRNPALILRGSRFTLPEETDFQKGLDSNNVFLLTDTLELGEQTWVITVEKSVQEALAPAIATINIVILVLLGALIIASLLGFLAARSISQPIQTLVKSTQSIMSGDFSKGVGIKSQDEIGTLATVFDNMRLELRKTLDELEQRVANRTRDLEVAADVSQQITSLLNLDILLNTVAERTRAAFNLYHVFVWLGDKEAGLFRLKAGAGTQATALLQREDAIKIDSPIGLIPRAYRTRENVLINDVSQAPDYLYLPELPDTKAELVIPLILGDMIFGVLDLQHDVMNRFDADDLRVFSILAKQIAVAVRNANLYEETLEARQAAEKADELKSRFLSIVSHELRTPLNGILNFTQMVSTGLHGEVNERQVATLTMVVDNGQHLLTLINDILDISKIEAGGLDFFMETNVDLSKALRIAIHTGEALARQKDLHFIVEIPVTLEKIYGDAQRLRQVVLNLVSNAIKYTDTGHVTLRIHQDSVNTQIAVVDTGIGIDTSDLERIFAPFQQTSAGIKHGQSSTGLGLPIAKHIVEAHGGQILVHSQPNVGSTFTIVLPRSIP